MSVSRQAELLGISRSSVYYLPKVNAEEVTLTRVIDEIYTTYPFYGSRKIKAALNKAATRQNDLYAILSRFSLPYSEDLS